MKVTAVALLSTLALLILTSSGSAMAYAGAAAAPNLRGDIPASSTNWSGYAVTGGVGSVTSVVGSWTVPAAKCPATGSLYSSFWVGIDGFSSSTVEQTGTDSDCQGGAAHYYAWYEFFPKPSFLVSGMPVHPGDAITASVTFSAGAFTVTINDITGGTSFSKTSSVSSAQETSAEFIAEAPSVCTLSGCHLAPLSNFGTVKFGSDYTGQAGTCQVTVGGVTGNLGSFGSSLVLIKMVSASSHTDVKAQPSAVSTDGTSFTIKWIESK